VELEVSDGSEMEWEPSSEIGRCRLRPDRVPGFVRFTEPNVRVRTETRLRIDSPTAGVVVCQYPEIVAQMAVHLWAYALAVIGLLGLLFSVVWMGSARLRPRSADLQTRDVRRGDG